MTKDINVVNLTMNEDDEEDENFSSFLEELKEGNESAIFIITRKDGTTAVGSTYKSVKDLVWDIERLIMFAQDLVRGGV